MSNPVVWICTGAITIGVIAAIAGAQSRATSPGTLGQLCDRYARAVRASMPRIPPCSPVPPGYPNAWQRSANQDCLQMAAFLGISTTPRSGRPGQPITPPEAKRLIVRLTKGTIVHVNL